MADQTNEGFLAGLPFVGSFFKAKTEVIDTPVTSSPIPDEGSLDTTPMVVLPDEPPAKPADAVPAQTPPAVTPSTPTTTSTKS